MSRPLGSDSKEFACDRQTQVRSLGWEDPLEKEMVTHSKVDPWTEEPGGLQQSPCGRKESDMTEQLTLSLLFQDPGLPWWFRR